jgi:proline iminopeptidase
MKNELYFLIISATLLLSCAEKQETANAETECKSTYFDYSNNEDQITGGIK